MNILVNRNFFDFLYIIGRGGFGKVWKVRLKKSNEYFALKEMSKVKIIDRRSEISIMSERNLLSNLHHPFIVNMYFAFQDFCNLYLVMDLLTGGDLRYHIAHQKTFTEMQTKFFISNMLLALEYIHSQNIIHRDIKPENLVLESNGYLRITDFGVAKINEVDNSSETSGTPGYMAPEVILVQNHSFPSDFFALGVIGYEFMLGYRPYLGRGRKEIKHLIIAKQAKLNIEEVPEDWSDESRDFINLLLQRKPRKRLGFNGVKEIKDHPWMNNINWDLLFQKKIEAPFVPPLHKENFDKKYCEGEDNVGEETIERYELYFQSELYGDVFKNYTFVNINYVNKYSKRRRQQKLNMLNNNGLNMNLNRDKVKHYTIDKDSNYNSIQNINNNENLKNLTLQKNTIDYDTNLKLDKNKNIEENNTKYEKQKNEEENIILKANSSKNEKTNIFNNSNKKVVKGTKILLSKNYGKSSASTNNLNYKYNSPLINENIICNNYINFNFNNYQNNGNKNKKPNNNYIIENNSNKIDMSSLKQLFNNHESNDINLYNSEQENNLYSKNTNNFNKKINNKSIMTKSSSMKFINNFQSNNMNLLPEKKKTKIVLLKNINQEINDSINKLSNIDEEFKTTPMKNKLSKDRTGDKITRGASDYNLKIDTNYLDFFSLQSKYGKNRKEKTLSKTISSDKLNMVNNFKIKNNDLDNKLSQLIHKNIINNNNINGKSIKINNLNKQLTHDYSTINVYSNNRNNYNINNNYSYLKKIHKTNSMINISSDNNLKREYIIKNKTNQNFPSINSINSPASIKSFELNTININTNSIQPRQNTKKRSFNTINSTNLNLNKVQSLKNIHGPTINNNNPSFERMQGNSPPISFNLFNFNEHQKTRNKNRSKNLFNKNNKNLNLNLGVVNLKSKNFLINTKINNFNKNF